MHDKIWCEKSGFTLVEVLIATMITAVALVGMLRLFVFCTSLAEMSDNMTGATAEAQNKMDEIRNHNFASIAADYAPGGTPGDTFALVQVSGTGTITIDSSTPNLLGIGITVSWQEDNGRTLTATLETLLAKR